MRQSIRSCTVAGILWACCAVGAAAQDVNSLLVRIKAVGREGAGNADAARAWKDLVRHGPTVLPDVLAGLDDASPVAVNWLRAAVEAIQDKGIAGGQKIPADKIEAFLRDTRHTGRARRLAYECLVQLDPKTPDRLLPDMLNDPSSELRRDAVEVKLKQAMDEKAVNVRKHAFKDLLQYARDQDQVNTISGELKKLGIPVDLTSHFGFVTTWLLAGPFDNSKGIGFNSAYAPEKGIEVNTTYAGKENQLVRWRPHTTTKPLAMVDLNQEIGKLHGVVGYGYAAIASETERPVELRHGSNNAVRLWLNGQETYFREEYHHGMQMDQHVGKGMLKAGRNEILIKVCQNEQKEDWAQLWSFQLRVCDSLGAAVPITNITEKVK